MRKTFFDLFTFQKMALYKDFNVRMKNALVENSPYCCFMYFMSGIVRMEKFVYPIG